MKKRVALTGIALLAVSGIWTRAYAQCEAAGVFTAAQANAGLKIYQQACANCHGGSFEGGEAGGPLAGDAFLETWRQLSVADLHGLMATTMPQSWPGALSEQQYLDITALLLQENGYAAGKHPLTAASLAQAGVIELLPAGPGVAVATSGKDGTDNEMVEWLHHRGDPGSKNYSSLTLINRKNVGNLKIAWRWRSDNFGPTLNANLQTTPIMANGVLYATAGSRRSVVAIDGATGETLWMHRIDEGERGANAPRKGPGRGVAYWRRAEQSRVFVITPGYQLVALDAASGMRIDSFGRQGVVDLKQALDPQMDLTKTPIGASSPPLVIGDVIVVGAAFPAGGAPPSKTMPPGNISAYDVISGKQLWVFNTVPQAGEFGNNTWQQDSWRYTGNTGAWAPLSADPQLGYVYIPLEAPTGDHYGGHRPGDNLFSQSLLCLNAKTGRRVWHYQTVHHGIWDYDLPAPPVLFDWRGNDSAVAEPVPAVAQVTKQGFVFVLDRRTGVPLFPVQEQPVPASDVPGEVTAPTQPIPSLPAPFTPQGISEASLNHLTPDIHKAAKTLVADYRLGKLYTPPSLRTSTNQGTLFSPAAAGGANWQGGVLDPATGVLYVSSTNTIGAMALVSDPERSDMRFINRYQRLKGPFGLPLAHPPWGTITAIDLNAGTHVWAIANGDTPKYVRDHPKLQGVTLPRTGHNDRAGLLVTATLLFAGEGAGLYVANEGGTAFRAHDKATGEIVAEIDLGARQSGIPMTYAISGKQYIVMAAATPGGAGELVALSVDPL